MENVVSVDNSGTDLTKEVEPALPGFTIDFDPQFDSLTAPIHTIKSHHNRNSQYDSNKDDITDDKNDLTYRNFNYDTKDDYSSDETDVNSQSRTRNVISTWANVPAYFDDPENNEDLDILSDTYKVPAIIHNPYSYILGQKGIIPIIFDKQASKQRNTHSVIRPSLTLLPWMTRFLNQQYRESQNNNNNAQTDSNQNDLRDGHNKFETNGESSEAEFWLKKRTSEKQDKEMEYEMELKKIYDYGLALTEQQVQIPFSFPQLKEIYFQLLKYSIK